MLPINLSSSSGADSTFLEQLNSGLPTLWRLAVLCSNAIGNEGKAETSSESMIAKASQGLSQESKTMLYLAKNRGAFDIKVDRNAFDSADRMLTVHIETDDNIWQPCKVPNMRKKNIAYLESFFAMCRSGLILHHVSSEFSLSSLGFQVSEQIESESVEDEIRKLAPVDM